MCITSRIIVIVALFDVFTSGVIVTTSYSTDEEAAENQHAVIIDESVSVTCTYQLEAGETVQQLDIYEENSSGSLILVTGGTTSGLLQPGFASPAYEWEYDASSTTTTLTISNVASDGPETFYCLVTVSPSDPMGNEDVTLLTPFCDRSSVDASSYSMAVRYDDGNSRITIEVTRSVSCPFPLLATITDRGNAASCTSTSSSGDVYSCVINGVTLNEGDSVEATSTFLGFSYSGSYVQEEEDESDDENGSGCEVGCIIAIVFAVVILVVVIAVLLILLFYRVFCKKKVSVYCTGFPLSSTEEDIRKAFQSHLYTVTVKLLTESQGHAFISLEGYGDMVERARKITEFLIIKAVVLVHCTGFPPRTTEEHIRETFPKVVTVTFQTERSAWMTFESETKVDEIVKKGSAFTVGGKEVQLKKVVVSVLYCTDIHPYATEKEIKEVFPDADNLEVQIPPKSDGHAYLTFQTEAKIDKIINDQDGYTIRHRTVVTRKISHEESNDDVKVERVSKCGCFERVAHSDVEEARSGSVTSASHVTANEKGTSFVTGKGHGPHLPPLNPKT